MNNATAIHRKKDQLELIQFEQKVNNDPSYKFYGASIEFINLGQNYVWIDEIVKIGPLESREFHASPGKYLYHKFKIRFEAISAPRSVVPGRTNAGNHLSIVRIIPAEEPL